MNFFFFQYVSLFEGGFIFREGYLLILGSVWCKVGFSVEGEGGGRFGWELWALLKKLLKELYVYALMSETFMAGDYPQESLFLWTVMIFVDATNLHFSREFIYADYRLTYKTLQKLSTYFHCINANKNKIHICHKIIIKCNDNYTLCQSSQSFLDLFFCKHLSWKFRNPWQKINILFSWELLIFF